MLKDSFLHLPVFLVLFVAAFCVLLFLSLLSAWAMVYNPAFPLEAGWLGSQIRANAGEVLLASVFVALFLLLFRMRRKPGYRLLSIVFPLIGSWILMLVGITFVYGPPGSPLPRQQSSVVPFIVETIHETESELVYVDEVNGERQGTEGIRLKNVVRYQHSKFQYFTDATVAVRSAENEGSAVMIPGDTSQEPVTVSPANPVYHPVFSSPGVISGLADDIAALNDLLLETRAESPGEFSLFLLSVLLPAVSCVCFMRFTRWPLFDALLTLAAFRGLFLLVRFLVSDIGTEMRNMIPVEAVSETVFILVFSALGVLLIAVNLVFPGKRHG